MQRTVHRGEGKTVALATAPSEDSIAADAGRCRRSTNQRLLTDLKTETKRWLEGAGFAVVDIDPADPSANTPDARQTALRALAPAPDADVVFGAGEPAVYAREGGNPLASELASTFQSFEQQSAGVTEETAGRLQASIGGTGEPLAVESLLSSSNATLSAPLRSSPDVDLAGPTSQAVRLDVANPNNCAAVHAQWLHVETTSLAVVEAVAVVAGQPEQREVEPDDEADRGSDGTGNPRESMIVGDPIPDAPLDVCLAEPESAVCDEQTRLGAPPPPVNQDFSMLPRDFPASSLPNPNPDNPTLGREDPGTGSSQPPLPPVDQEPERRTVGNYEVRNDIGVDEPDPDDTSNQERSLKRPDSCAVSDFAGAQGSGHGDPILLALFALLWLGWSMRRARATATGTKGTSLARSRPATLRQTTRRIVGACSKPARACILLGTNTLLCLLLGAFLCLGTGGCAATQNRANRVGPPALTGISTNWLRIGERLRFSVDNAVGSEFGWVGIRFEGQYLRDQGGAEDVNVEVPLYKDGHANTVTWDEFGNGRIPWGACAEPGGACSTGCFQGTVRAVNRFYDGSAAEQSGGLVLDGGCGSASSLDIRDSIVVRAFTPFRDNGSAVGGCRFPVKVAQPVDDVSYLFDFETIGFAPELYEIIVDGGLQDPRDPMLGTTTPVSHSVQNPEGNRHRFVFKPAKVPAFSTGYKTNIAVIAQSGGTRTQLSYNFLVRPSFVIRMRSGRVPVQYFPPERSVPASGNAGASACIFTGYDAAASQTYSSSETTVISRSFSISEAENWSASIGNSVSGTYLEGRTNASSLGSVSNRQLTRDESTGVSDGSSFGYSLAAANTETGSLVQTGSFARGLVSSASESDKQISEVDSDLTDVEGNDVLGEADNLSNVRGAMAREEADSGIESGSNQNTTDANALATGASGTVAEGISDLQSTVDSESNTDGEAKSRSLSTNRSLAETESYANTVGETKSFSRNRASSVAESFSVTQAATIGDGYTVLPLPVRSGAWFTQKVKLMTFADIIAYDACGVGTVVGEMTLDNWTWNVEFGTAESCADVAPRCLPTPRCLVDQRHCEPANPSNYRRDLAACSSDHLYDGVLNAISGRR